MGNLIVFSWNVSKKNECTLVHGNERDKLSPTKTKRFN